MFTNDVAQKIINILIHTYHFPFFFHYTTKNVIYDVEGRCEILYSIDELHQMMYIQNKFIAIMAEGRKI